MSEFTPTGYIGKVQIDSGDILPVGSTLFGVCNTPAATANKVIETSDVTLGATFSPLDKGITIHVQFTNGNTASAESLTLKVGATLVHDIKNPGGSCAWSQGAVVSFTYDGTNWVCNDGTMAEITVVDTYSSSGTFPITGTGVAAALGTLDVDNDATSSVAHHITGFGAGKTLATLTEVDGIIYATFQDIAIDKSKVSGLGDAAAKGVVTGIIDSGNNANNTNDTVPTTAAVATYVAGKTAGITGAMHYIGAATVTVNGSTITVTGLPSGHTLIAGDVVTANNKEYVYDGSSWRELGDEGSYVLKSSVNMSGSVGSASGWNAGSTPTLGTEIDADEITSWSQGTLPSLGTEIPADDITDWSAGSAATFTVTSGVLHITTGSAPSLSYTAKSIPNVTGVGTLPTLQYTEKSIPNVTSVGTAPSLTVTNTTVVVPAAT